MFLRDTFDCNLFFWILENKTKNKSNNVNQEYLQFSNGQDKQLQKLRVQLNLSYYTDNHQ